MHLPKRSEFLPYLGTLLGIIMSASLPEAAPSRAASAPRPNFIFILTDDHGWAESSVQMHPDIPDSRCSYLVTPNLERFAAAGMRFSRGYAPGPLCTPTRRALLVGMTAARDRGSEFKSNFFNPSQHLTIPKALKAVDPAYRCAHFGKWGENMEASPTQCGYDESDGDTGNLTGNGPSNWRQGGEQTSPQPDPKRIFSLTDRAIDFITRQAREGRPFYMQPPLESKVPFRARLRGRRDDRHKQRARLDLLADLRIPRIAADELVLVKPHLDAGRAQR